MAKRLNKVISVAMTEEQYEALKKEASRRGARIPDVVRWLASQLVSFYRTTNHDGAMWSLALPFINPPREPGEGEPPRKAPGQISGGVMPCQEEGVLDLGEVPDWKERFT